MGVKTHAGESIFEAKAAFKRAQEKLKRRLVAAPAEAELAAKEDDDDEHEDHDEDEHDKDEAPPTETK